MSRQKDEAFEEWAQGCYLHAEMDIRFAKKAWYAALASVAEDLELARRVKALPVDFDVNRCAHVEVIDAEGELVGEGATALEALRAAHIGDE
jgi:hypothetical protein